MKRWIRGQRQPVHLFIVKFMPFRAGLRNARAKGKRLGRPRHAYPQAKVERLRAQGLSWADVAGRVGVPKATLLRKEKA